MYECMCACCFARCQNSFLRRITVPRIQTPDFFKVFTRLIVVFYGVTRFLKQKYLVPVIAFWVPGTWYQFSSIRNLLLYQVPVPILKLKAGLVPGTSTSTRYRYFPRNAGTALGERSSASNIIIARPLCVCVCVCVQVAFPGAVTLFGVALRYPECELRVFQKITEFLSGLLLHFVAQPRS
jgi:hypothetical protein